MYAMINTKVTQERNCEDGVIYSFFVYWVTVVCEASGTQWHHDHVVTVPSRFGDSTPFELQMLAARVEDALWEGTGADHFHNSPHWYADEWKSLEGRLGSYGAEWEIEQQERTFGLDGPAW